MCTLFLVPVTATSEQSTSFWDMIPVIAQGKSLVQLIFGDKDGALKTQENFLNEGLITSQFRSAYSLVTGEPKKAWDIQKKSLSNMQVVIDNVPLLGHIKGGIQLIAGDHDGGWQALKSATSTCGSILGGMLAGPAGAIGGNLLMDSLITTTDFLINQNQSQSHGLISYINNLNKMKPGDHFDAIAGMVIDAKVGHKFETKRGKFVNFGPKNSNENLHQSYELQPLLKNEHLGSSEFVKNTGSMINEPGPSHVT